ncbi:MAG: hypothetical protein NC548_47655 [Lachnospiraceae bacterium]|nr:hypothetical protein [Bacteroides sp.]MCM1222172.1 hypothetical protein [Lachnospiraceae bacterium]
MSNIAQLPYFTIDLMRSVINKEDLLSEKVDELIHQIAQCSPSAESEYLLTTAHWLKEHIESMNDLEKTKVNIADFIEMYCGRIPSKTLEKLHSCLNRGMTEAELSDKELNEIISNNQV